MVYKPLTLILW